MSEALKLTDTTTDYATLSVSDLRRLVLEKGLARGTAVAGARKADLVALLTGETDGLPAAPLAAAASNINTTLADVLLPLARTALDEAIGERGEIRPIVQIVMAGQTYTLPDQAHHARLPDVLRLIAAGLPDVLLVGPSGTGKSHLAKQVAEALHLDFAGVSLSAGVTESTLYGRVLPKPGGAWEYTESAFVRVWRDGGLYLLDELDAADPNLLVSLNSALSNGLLFVPNAPGMPPTPRSPNTRIIATANTYGHGADRQYVGRNQLDTATLERFVCTTLTVDYDPELERQLVAAICPDQVDALTAWARTTRECVTATKLRRVVSTRALIRRAQLAKAGFTPAELDGAYYQGWTDDERKIAQA